MKKIAIALILGIIVLSSISLAQEELPKPFLLPDHPLYSFSRWFEKVRMFFTFDEEAKAKLHLHFAELRLAEAKAMVEKGKPEWSESLMREYRLELNETQKRMQRQRQLGRDISLLTEHVMNATYKHVDILEKVLEMVPGPAKEHIEKAINASSKNCLETLKRIREDNPEKAAEFASEFAKKELNKSIEMFRKGRPELAQKRLQMYKEFLNETEEATERIERLGKNVTSLAEHVCNMTYKHVEVLEKVLEEVPEEAKPAIEKAINASMKGHEKCAKRIQGRIGWIIREIRKTSCTSDADCRDLFCPMIIGHDTPVCKEGRCWCGGKWEINATEWRERFKGELTSEAQRRMEKISKMYNQTEIEEIVERIQGMRRS